MSRHRVVIVVFDGFQLRDLAGPTDVFSAACLLDPGASYEVEVTAVRAGTVRSPSGVTVTVELPLRAVAGPIDTPLVVRGLPARIALADSPSLGPEGRSLAARHYRFRCLSLS